jgi:iron complex outermembrane receptor protein
MSAASTVELARLGAIVVVIWGCTRVSTVLAQPVPMARLPAVVITANPLGSELVDMVPPVSVLAGERLLLNMQPTLGEITNILPGVNSTYYGPNASRPVIRGLEGDRIRVLSNGLGMFDASGTSVDHAVALDTLTLKRVEVVRGPATLLYGATAVGGVVNAIDYRIPYEPMTGFDGAAELRYGSAATEKAASGFLEFGTAQGLQFHVDGFKRRTGDLRIAGYAYSPQLRATLPADEQGPVDRLPNSASDSDGGSFGVAYTGNKGFVGASYTQFDTDYGTVAEPDVTIQLQQKRVNFAGEWREPMLAIKSVAVKFAQSDYEHTEFEGAEVGTVFKSKGYEGRIDLAHNRVGPFVGVVGLQTLDFDFSAQGEEAFLPSTKTRDNAIFLFEQARFAPVTLEVGFRYDNTKVSAADSDSFGPGWSRTFNTTSGSLGALVELRKNYVLAASAVYTQRPPNYQELFANGPHVATGLFEVGDRGLPVEKSLGLDIALRKGGEGWTGSVGYFYNRFNDYIALLNTGGIEDDLPLYQYTSIGKAIFQGVEAEASIELGRYAGGWWQLGLQADWLRATDDTTGQPLPRISPVRFGGGLAYSRDAWNARVDLQRVQKQDRVAPDELPTDGYTMLNASLTYQFTRDKLGLTGFVKGVNLLNEDARNHVSYLVNIAPMGARGMVAGLRGTF